MKKPPANLRAKRRIRNAILVVAAVALGINLSFKLPAYLHDRRIRNVFRHLVQSQTQDGVFLVENFRGALSALQFVPAYTMEDPTKYGEIWRNNSSDSATEIVITESEDGSLRLDVRSRPHHSARVWEFLPGAWSLEDVRTDAPDAEYP